VATGWRWGSPRTRRDGKVFLSQLLNEILPAALGKEEAGGFLLESVLDGEGFGSGAGEHDIWRFLHDGAGEVDGMARVLDVGDGSGFHSGAVHDRSVHLISSVGGEDGAASGVEERIVFKDLDRGLHGVDGGASFVENGSGGGDGLGESVAVLTLGVKRHGGALDDACSTMEDDGPFRTLNVFVLRRAGGVLCRSRHSDGHDEQSCEGQAFHCDAPCGAEFGDASLRKMVPFFMTK
jgi:hypothetical protein